MDRREFGRRDRCGRGGDRPRTTCIRPSPRRRKPSTPPARLREFLPTGMARSRRFFGRTPTRTIRSIPEEITIFGDAFQNTFVCGMNDAGEIVGGSYHWRDQPDKGRSRRAYIWDADGGIRDLNELIPEYSIEGYGPFLLTQADGINNSGQIVVTGWFDTDENGTRGSGRTGTCDGVNATDRGGLVAGRCCQQRRFGSRPRELGYSGRARFVGGRRRQRRRRGEQCGLGSSPFHMGTRLRSRGRSGTVRNSDFGNGASGLS